ncbi:protein kinase domain-containing protein [Colletotrichum graminicola M1.001]|uniref:Protein kinase domain-containing protein n=1 Tax=Colletotrichum graminicola (strain M1.001 / M2 / FGSC 10212) TaxID=645133 RepID=E3QHJ7_COLGM|nr:protein kinase domain-containing protein [Colletotrichum graminicola M1.001]EFQ30168.1 protein kinase domain-containing protein [Colletotrichum graminicola M1.001]
MNSKTRSCNDEVKDGMAVDLDTMVGSITNELKIDKDSHSHSKRHPSSQHDTPRVPHSAGDKPLFPWKVVDDFRGGQDIGSNIFLSVNDKRRDPSEADAVLSVYDMGLGIAPQAADDPQKHDRSQSEATDPVSCEAYPKTDSFHSADDTCIGNIVRDKMEKSLCWSKMDRKEYLPRDAFDEIFTIPTVKSLIKAIYHRATDDELSCKINQVIGDTEKSRRMIVAILVFMKQTSHIDDFIREGIFDHHMPLRHTRESMRNFRTRAEADEVEDINETLFKGWERVHVDLFYIYQQMIVVPIFDMDDGPIRIHILDHDKPKHPQCFAVKEIHAADHESYSKELRALLHSCNRVQKEKHLIKLMFSFQHGERLYLVFEWADGNLQEFWAKKKVQSSAVSARWMLQQCRGIANAVKRIHGLTTWQKEERRSTASSTEEEESLIKDWGRHGDIKPSNILWFSKYGEDHDHLVVADLGLTRYHSRLTRSRVLRVDGFTGTYRAPEVDLGDLISPKYDIWSLGCVFLEFCVWYLFGPRVATEFERERRPNRSKEAMEPGEFDNSYFVTKLSAGRKKAVLHPAIDTVSITSPQNNHIPKYIIANFRVINSGFLR